MGTITSSVSHRWATWFRLDHRWSTDIPMVATNNPVLATIMPVVATTKVHMVATISPIVVTHYSAYGRWPPKGWHMVAIIGPSVGRRWSGGAHQWLVVVVGGPLTSLWWPQTVLPTSLHLTVMAVAPSPREEFVYMAKLAKQAERYEEMVEFIEKVSAAVESDELTNMIFARRASWSTISSIEQKEENPGNEDHVSVIHDYRSKIETELSNICDGILKLLDSHLIPSTSSGDSKVFYLKRKGDYHRYLAEFKTGAECKEAAESTLTAYKAAQDIANAELAPTHPIRLGLALNFSMLFYEILNSLDSACNLAK
ncbi:hypothetical protein FNV43_RR11077 [Rhamnella rubrinervis]|uniref:14-3-3 domain-containing protein n=1 Tax=Rhamnella rubrinervis TaxID=2594499 RepID=A0A8K0H553_9ROSA|nr:hypothetical protein FNV43_RR11077 [Rhamnella rubrinervis]